jgi:GNAT superfamily N-acetyltransferase
MLISRPSEKIHLADDAGRPLLLRAVLPEDKWRFVEGLTRLSPAGRFQRFFTPLNHFTDEQLQYLTEVDQKTHVAWGLCDRTAPGQPGIGVGRYIVTEEGGDVGDFAITVIDEFQGRGLGRILLATLGLLAVDRGIRAFRGDVHFKNELVLGWLARLGASSVREGKRVVMDLPLDLDAWRARGDAFAETLRMLEPLLPLRGRPEDVEEPDAPRR